MKQDRQMKKERERESFRTRDRYNEDTAGYEKERDIAKERIDG